MHLSFLFFVFVFLLVWSCACAYNDSKGYLVFSLTKRSSKNLPCGAGKDFQLQSLVACNSITHFWSNYHLLSMSEVRGSVSCTVSHILTSIRPYQCPDFCGACDPLVYVHFPMLMPLVVQAVWFSNNLCVQERTMRELELRVKQQSAEVEKGNTLRQKVTQEKAELEIHIASISTELQEANRRYEPVWRVVIGVDWKIKRRRVARANIESFSILTSFSWLAFTAMCYLISMPSSHLQKSLCNVLLVCSGWTVKMVSK